PRWGRRRLSERNTGKGSLADRVEGRVSGRNVGAERVVETPLCERELIAASRQGVLHDVLNDSRRWEPGLEVRQVLALIRSEPGGVDEADHVPGCPGCCNDRTPVRMPHQKDRPIDLMKNALEVLAVAATETSQGIRRSDDRHVFAQELVI